MQEQEVDVLQQSIEALPTISSELVERVKKRVAERSPLLVPLNEPLPRDQFSNKSHKEMFFNAHFQNGKADSFFSEFFLRQQVKIPSIGRNFDACAYNFFYELRDLFHLDEESLQRIPLVKVHLFVERCIAFMKQIEGNIAPLFFSGESAGKDFQDKYINSNDIASELLGTIIAEEFRRLRKAESVSTKSEREIFLTELEEREFELSFLLDAHEKSIKFVLFLKLKADGDEQKENELSAVESMLNENFNLELHKAKKERDLVNGLIKKLETGKKIPYTQPIQEVNIDVQKRVLFEQRDRLFKVHKALGEPQHIIQLEFLLALQILLHSDEAKVREVQKKHAPKVVVENERDAKIAKLRREFEEEEKQTNRMEQLARSNKETMILIQSLIREHDISARETEFVQIYDDIFTNNIVGTTGNILKIVMDHLLALQKYGYLLEGDTIPDRELPRLEVAPSYLTKLEFQAEQIEALRKEINTRVRAKLKVK